MRRPSTLDALFPPPRQDILTATLMAPERWWYLSDLARHLGLHHATLQRELGRLSKAEILVSKRDGDRTYYKANPDSPLFPELQGLVTKTTGLIDVLRGALRTRRRQIAVTFVFGSVARTTEGVSSDVDLTIAGDIGLADIAVALQKAERTIGRPINPKLYTAPELAKKLDANNPFLRRVIDQQKLFVVGDQDDLDRLAQGRPPRGPHPGAGRNRRPAKGS